MKINHITFADFDDLQLAHESSMQVKLSRFRDSFSSDAQEEAAPVVFYGHDGNDYFVVDTGASFWLIGVTVPEGEDDGFCDWVAFTEFGTLGAALEEMQAITETDYDTAHA